MQSPFRKDATEQRAILLKTVILLKIKNNQKRMIKWTEGSLLHAGQSCFDKTQNVKYSD